MRVELVRGRWLLCGVILPHDMIAPSQTWAAADGSANVVEVESVRRHGELHWVTYTWTEKGAQVRHEKDAFSFQCRYCLVVPGNQVPQVIQAELRARELWKKDPQ